MKIENGRYLCAIDIGTSEPRLVLVPTSGAKVLWDRAITMNEEQLDAFIDHLCELDKKKAKP